MVVSTMFTISLSSSLAQFRHDRSPLLGGGKYMMQKSKGDCFYSFGTFNDGWPATLKIFWRRLVFICVMVHPYLVRSQLETILLEYGGYESGPHYCWVCTVQVDIAYVTENGQELDGTTYFVLFIYDMKKRLITLAYHIKWPEGL